MTAPCSHRQRPDRGASPRCPPPASQPHGPHPSVLPCDSCAATRPQPPLLLSGWTKIYECGPSGTGSPYLFPAATIQTMAGFAKRVKICTGADCVESTPNSKPIERLRDGKNIPGCSDGCIRGMWSATGSRSLTHLVGSHSNKALDVSLYHANANPNGLHLQLDNGQCTWDLNAGNTESIAVYIDVIGVQPTSAAP